MRLLGEVTLTVLCAAALVACGDDSPISDAGPPPDGAALDAPLCASADDCDDGLFCTGAEICQPGSVAANARGCVQLPAECLTGQTCDELMDACVTDCGVARDADGDGHQAAVCGGDDCDDADAARYPGNAEVCDDASHDEDCDSTTFGTRDGDGDGRIDALCCNASATGVPICGDDCNDGRLHIGPLATEVCNGVDDDCNGMVDEGVLVAAFEDRDHDLHGDPARAVMVCPFANGISLLDDDCDDENPRRHPAQSEICDMVDNDCNGVVDDFTHATTWYADNDGDGFGSAQSGTMISCTPLTGYSLLPTDCDDAHRGVGPAASEICDGLDDDCNGLADFIVATGDFEDDDGDGAIDALCPRVGTDCDDLDENVRPGAPEICDGKDGDCNGAIDDGTGSIAWYVDVDGDGYGDDAAATTMSCARPPGRVSRGGDCDDSSGSLHPGAIDGCDGRDDDCNGEIDEHAQRSAFYVDADGDGAGVGTAVLACVAPPGAGTTPGDCDDANTAVFPGAMELCNGLDDDCDGSVDVAVTTTFYPDDDGDGHGAVGSVGRIGCAPSGSYAPVADDCVDTDAAVHPGTTETCNALDDDCDGTVDGAAAASMCRAASHSTATCTAGACVIVSCDANYADCDRVFFDGCETDLRTTPTHCGGCGVMCGEGDACVASACADSPFVQVVGGTNFTCARRATGGVGCWGLGTSGQHGDGSFAPTSTPVTTAVTDAIDITAGNLHACAVRRGGGVVCWGSNGYGQIGDGTLLTQVLPTPVVGLSDAVDVSAGSDYTCAVRATGAVVCWGLNNYSVLGTDAGALASSATPLPVAGIMNAVAVATSASAACALLVDRRVLCWGLDTSGQLGSGTSGSGGPMPVSVVGVSTAISIAASPAGASFCAVLGSGEGRCWGDDTYGQLGDGAVGAAGVPSAPSGLRDLVSSALTANAGCWLRRGGTVTCSGYGDRGELGDGTVATRYLPGADIPMLSGVTSISGGTTSFCATLSTGGVVCWGANVFGEIGDGTTTQRELPTAVVGLP